MFSQGKRFKLFLTALDLRDGKLGFVWGQHESRFDEYARLESLLTEGDGNSDKEKDNKFDIGDIVIARYEDGNWYRSQILEEGPNPKFKVSFMDFGNVEFVTKSDLRVGNPKLFELPPLATKFIMGDICAGNETSWSEQEKATLEEQLINTEFLVEVLGSDTAGRLPTLRILDDSNNPLSTQLLTSGVGRAYDNNQLKMLHIQPCKLTVGKEYKVYISFTESAMKFWVHLKNFEKQVEQMEVKLLEYIENGLHQLKSEEKIQGMACVAKYDEADAYYRSVITGVHHEDGCCTVQFVDYGNSERVPHSDLYMLPREEAMVHGLCVECSLTGKAVRTTDFNKLIDAEDVTINVLSFTGNSYVVEVMDDGTGQSQQPQTDRPSSQMRSISIASSTAIPYVPIEFDMTTPHNVCISHVEKDGTFHLQLVEYAPVLESLMAQLGDKATAPLIGTMSKGKPCVVRDAREMISYRGEVLANDVGTIQVKLVDFGNIEGFSVSGLCGIDPDSMKLPTQARHCVLVGGDAQNPRQLFQLLKSYESCQVLVCSVVGRDNNRGLLKVDLYDPSKRGAQLLSLLSTSESPRYQSAPAAEIVSSSHLNPSSSVFLPPPDVKSKSVESLYMMAVMSDTEIYCQLTKYSQETLEDFQSQLQSFYNKPDVVKVRSPKVGDICCSQFTEDQQFYRSKVLSISGDMATILFVDYGNQEIVQGSALKELAPQFCNLPVQGVVCCFDENYSDLNTDVLTRLADHELVVNVVKKEPTRVFINLADIKENADAIKILARYKKPKDAGRSKDHSSNKYKKPFFTKGMWDECFVTFADDPQSFYVQLTSHADELNSVMDKLDSYCGSVDATQAQPDVLALSLPVAAKYSDDGEWYRALITGILKNGNVEVFFVDFGNSDMIPKSDLRKLTPELMETPIQGIKCTLNRIKAGSMGLWTPVDLEEFHNLVFDTTGSVIFKVQVGTYTEVEDKYYVELFRKDVNINESFLSGRGYLKANEEGPGLPPDVLPFIPGQQKASAPKEAENSGWASGFIKTSQKQEVASTNDSQWTEPAIRNESNFGNPQTKGFNSGDPGKDFANKSEQRSSGFGNPSSFKQTGAFEEKSGFGKSSFGTGSDGGSANRGGCFKCGEDGHISRNCPNAESRQGGGREGGGGGWDRNEMLSMEVNRADVGKVIGKGGSKIKELQETSGTKIRVLSKDVTGEMIPVEIYGTEDQRVNAKDMIDQLLNATYGSGQSGYRRNQESNRRSGGFGTGSSDSWDNSGQKSGDLFGKGGFDDRGSEGFGNKANTKNTNDWGDSGTDGFKRSSEKSSFGERNRINQQQGNSYSKGDFGREQRGRFGSDSGRGARSDFQKGSQSSGLRYKESNLPLNQYKELVITHHDSPSLFYFQLQDTYEKLETLMDKLQTFYGGLGVAEMALLNVIQDRICVAKYSEDDKWYRAKVVSAKGGVIRVFFVDYGNEEDVPPTAVKEITDDFLYLPTQALLGKVFGIKPKSDNWSLDAINRFIDLTGDVIVGTAVEGRNDGSYVMELTADNQPVHEVLCKEGLAVEEHDNIPVLQVASGRKLSTSSTSSTASSRAGDLRLKELTLPCGQKVEVYFSYASSPAQFWVNYTKNGAEMDELMSRIAAQYNSLAPGELMFTSVEVGSLCCARYERDKAWYRGKIKEVKKEKVLVDFVDYGNVEWVKHENIRQIVRAFTQLPAQAIACILDGAVPVGGKWTNEGIVKFEDLTEGDNLMAQVNSKEAPYYVSITQKESGIYVAEELVNAGFARQGRPVNQKSKFNPRKMNSGDRLEVIISWVISHKEFYCQIASEGNNLLSLQEKLSEFYESCRLKDEMLNDPQIGDSCVAYYPGDGNWYRGLVMKVGQSSMALVKYTDYGNSEKVQKTKLKAIKQEFESLPTFALKCAIKDVSGGEQVNWDEQAMALFRKLTQEKLTCCIDSVVSDLHKVDLLDGSGRSIIDRLLGKDEKIQPTLLNNNRFENKNRDSFSAQNNERNQGGRNFGMHDHQSNQSTTVGRYDKDNKMGGFGGRDDKSRGGGFNNDRKPDGGRFGSNKGSGFGNAAKTLASAGHGDDWGDVAKETPAVSTPKPAVSTTNLKLSLPEQQVPKGKQEVYISSVSSPANFYIQLLSTENEILEKTDQLTAEYEALGPSDRKDVAIAVGQLCCAKFVEDEAWYRAKIASVSGHNATVTFIDYGNAATVESSSLRFLPAVHCATAPLAYHCKLDKFNVYTDTDTEKLQEMSEEGVKVLQLEFKSSASCPYRVVLYDPANPEVNLTSKLPSFSKQPAETVIAYPKVNIPEGEVIGYVSHINSPASFAIQLQTEEDNLANVTGLLEGYSSAGDKLESVDVGSPCAAQFSEDEAWYRSRITSLDEGDKVTVEFVDYGNKDSVDKASLKELNELLLKDPPFAISCFLDGVPGTTFSENIIDSFSSHTVDKVSKIRFLTRKEPCSVVLYDNDVCVNDKVKELLTTADDATFQADSVDETENAPTESVNETITRFPVQPKLSGRYQAFVHHVESPREFYFQLLRDEHDKNELYDKLDKIYEESSVEILTTLQVGGVCCVKDSVNHTWNRSQICEMAEKVVVKFIDFGNCEEVSKEDLRILRPEFLEQPALSFRANLSGISDTDKEWPQDVSDKLVEETAEKVINIDIKSDGAPYEVVLLYNNQNLNQLILEDVPKEFVCEAEVSVSEDTESEQYESAVDEVPDELDTEEDQGEDTTITPAGDTSVQSIPESSVVQQSESETSLYSDLQETFDEGGSIDRSTTPVPVPLSQLQKGEKLEVYISHHVSPSQFWVHLESQQSELEQFTESLQEYYSSTDLSEDRGSVNTEDIYTGMMCVAKYSDEQWYRAVVRSVIDSEVEVLFIDFGNTEHLAVSELRKVSETFRKPLPFAIGCVLHGIRAKDGEWDETSLETFESLSAEHKLTAEVLLVNSEEGDSLYVVKLYDSSGNSLARAMLEQDMAEDVTSPLIHSRTSIEESPKAIHKDLPKFSQSLLEESDTEVARQFEVIDASGRHISVDDVQDTPRDKKSQENVAEIVQCEPDIEEVEAEESVDQDSSKERMTTQSEDSVQVQNITKMDDIEQHENGMQQKASESEEGGDYKDAELSKQKLEQIEPEVADQDLEESRGEGQVYDQDLEKSRGEGQVYDQDLEKSSDAEDRVTSSLVQEEHPSTKAEVRDTEEVDQGVVTQDTDLSNVAELSTISTDHIKLGCKVEGQVVYVKSPDKFWIQLQEFTQRFDDLVTEMQEYYSSLVVTEKAFKNIVDGCSCVIYSQDDETWYRGVVKNSTEGTSEVTVFYVDYGNEETVSIDNLQKLEERFGSLPCQAVECSLSDLEPCEGSDWDSEATDLLTEITLDQTLLIEVKGVQDLNYQVSLLDMGMPVANRLIAEKMGRRIGSNPDLTLDESRLDLTTVVEVERKQVEVVQADEDVGLVEDKQDIEQSQVTEDSSEELQVEKAMSEDDVGLVEDKENIEKLEGEDDAEIVEDNENIEQSHVTQENGDNSEELQVEEETGEVDLGLVDNGDLKLQKDKADLVIFDEPTLVEGTSVDVYIPHVETPESFYCQLVTSSAELPLFTDKLVDFYSRLSEEEMPLDDLTIGEACVAQFSESMSWYRARITDISEKGVHVFLVDYGNSEIVKRDHVRAIQQEFLHFPVQVFCCALSSLHPVSGGLWEEDSCSRLQEICSGIDTYDNKVFKAELKRVKHSKFGSIELVDVSVWDGDVNISQQLVDGGYARVVEQLDIGEPDEEEGQDIHQFAADIVSSTIELGKQKFLKEKQDKSPTEDSGESLAAGGTSEVCRSYESLTLQEGSEVEVVFLYGDSPGDLCLQLADDSAIELQGLLSKEDKRISKSEGEQFAVGEPCVCLDVENSKWQRGSIISIQEEAYEVTLVDENKTSVFPQDCVFAVSSEVLGFPALAIKCNLAGIIPASGHTWSVEACDDMQVLCRNKVLTAQIVEQNKDGYSVYLHNYVQDSTVSINHQLVRKGMAAFAKGYAMDLEYELNSKIESSFNDISLCMSNSLGSLDESAVVESCDEDAFRHLRYHVGQTVDTVFVNCTENHLICQPLETQQEVQEMSSVLNECYDMGDEPTLQSPQKGQPCCVRSAVDDSWHRAVILDIKTSPVAIARCYAVDTGDSIASSSEKVKLLQQKFFVLPAQAIVVKLTGLEDLSGRSTEIYNFLESNFVEDDGKVHLLLQVDRVNSENSVQATVFMNSGNTIKDELLENEILSPVQQADAEDVTQSSELEETEAPLDISAVKSLPDPEINTDDSQPVIVTHAESPSSFWCQLVTEGDDFQSLLDEYDAKVQNDACIKLEEGDFCVAFSAENKCWRRAKIQSEYAGLYSVQFVDYGICDTSETVLPMTASLAGIPVQAIHCMLPHLQPRDLEWSSEVEDLLSSYIDDKKQFSMRVHTPADIQPACVELYLDQSEQLTLIDVLLDKKLAKTDLSSTKVTCTEKDESGDTS